jgi:hypothetical protein
MEMYLVSRRLSLRAGGSVHAQKLSSERIERGDALVDALRLAGEIRVKGANDNSTVLRHLAVESNEMPPVECEYCTLIIGSKLEHFRVRDCLVGASGFRDGQHIMAEPS